MAVRTRPRRRTLGSWATISTRAHAKRSHRSSTWREPIIGRGCQAAVDLSTATGYSPSRPDRRLEHGRNDARVSSMGLASNRRRRRAEVPSWTRCLLGQPRPADTPRVLRACALAARRRRSALVAQRRSGPAGRAPCAEPGASPGPGARGRLPPTRGSCARPWHRPDGGRGSSRRCGRAGQVPPEDRRAATEARRGAVPPGGPRWPGARPPGGRLGAGPSFPDPTTSGGIVGVLASDVIDYLYAGFADRMRAPVGAALLGNSRTEGRGSRTASARSSPTVPLSEPAFRNRPLPLLVTLGSPLGIGNVQARLRDRAGRPVTRFPRASRRGPDFADHSIRSPWTRPCAMPSNRRRTSRSDEARRRNRRVEQTTT